jgi:hypothetical protein
MSLRLAQDGLPLLDTVSGAVVLHPHTGQPVYPFITDTGHVIYPIIGAAPEDGAEDDVDDEPDETSGSGDGATDKAGKGKTDDPDKQRLSSEAASYRRKLRATEQELAALRTEREEREAAERTELENATKTAEKLQSELQEARDAVTDLRIQNAFLTDNTFTWHNPQRALKLADLSEVEISDDGTVTGLKEALEALARSDSYLIKAEDKEDDEPEDDAPPTGGVTGKGKRGKDEADRQRLLNKYPSLRR